MMTRRGEIADYGRQVTLFVRAADTDSIVISFMPVTLIMALYTVVKAL